MPTGLTEKIKDGLTFQEFALKCARQLGGLVHMREMASDAKITLPNKSEYYKEELAKIKLKLKELSKIDVETYKANAIQERRDNIIDAEATVKEKAILRGQYMQMLIEVKAWSPPTDDHLGLQKLMIEQLTDSISFDCNTKIYEQLLEEYKQPVNIQEALYSQIDKLQEEAKYFKERIDSEGTQNSDRTEWVKELVASLNLTPEEKEKLLNFKI